VIKDIEIGTSASGVSFLMWTKLKGRRKKAGRENRGVVGEKTKAL